MKDVWWFIEQAIPVITAGLALFAAWLAARWALNRYKEERRWEHRTANFVELVGSISEMLRILQLWSDERQSEGEFTEAARDDHSRRYQTASRNLQTVASNARLILDEKTIAAIDDLQRDLRKADGIMEWYEHLAAEIDALTTAHAKIIPTGRVHIGADLGWTHPKEKG